MSERERDGTGREGRRGVGKVEEELSNADRKLTSKSSQRDDSEERKQRGRN